MTLHLLAPAKINLTLEVLNKREDGYHQIASILQTIDLCDRINLSESPKLELSISGPEAAGVPDDPRENLASRAAVALQQAAAVSLGARIKLEKRIPAGAGLGGGSSDAAAVLRGLTRLCGLDISPLELGLIAASLGSDVSFFLYGGTGAASGRGEVIEPLPDVALQEHTLFLASETMPDKTPSMYAALTPSDFTDGRLTSTARETIQNGGVLPASAMHNAFSRALAEIAPRVAAAMSLCRQAGVQVVVAGAGPSFFSPTPLGRIHPSLISVLESEYGVKASARRALAAAEALAIRES